jgi:hypothetical protein
MHAIHISVCAAMCVMVLGTRTARAMQQGDSQATAPTPDLHLPLALAADNDNAEGQVVNPQGAAPDTRPLTGAQPFSLGSLPLTRSFWQPLFNLTSTLDTNPLMTNQPSGLTTWTSLYGAIDMHRVSHRSDLTLNYLGGGLISNDGKAGSSLIQELELGEKLSGRRWAASFFDQLNYLPETAFGFAAPTELSLLGGQGPWLQPVLTANQSILTSRGLRISNTFLAEEDTFLTLRSSLTVVGSYSLLRFPAKSFLNVSDTVFQAGYNYEITREDTIALLYRFSAFRYSNFDQPIDGHTVQLSYGRRVTGRLALQVAAGPEVGLLRQSISPSRNSSDGSATTTSSSRQAYWTLDATMTYHTPRAQFGLAYDQSLSGGAGVLAGAVNSQVSGSANKQLSRRLNGGLVLGYARNQGLNVATPTPSIQTYNYGFGGVNVAHPWGRSTNVFLSYQVQLEDSNASFCIGTSCGNSFLRHTVSFGFDWRSSPIPIK